MMSMGSGKSTADPRFREGGELEGVMRKKD
jgi:hypothetical protein